MSSSVHLEHTACKLSFLPNTWNGGIKQWIIRPCTVWLCWPVVCSPCSIVRRLWNCLAGHFFGILLFSGSLYLLAITGNRSLGMVTPLGGLAFISGWCCLALAAWRMPK